MGEGKFVGKWQHTRRRKYYEELDAIALPRGPNASPRLLWVVDLGIIDLWCWAGVFEKSLWRATPLGYGVPRIRRGGTTRVPEKGTGRFR